MVNKYGLTLIGISTSPITCLLESSKALTTKALTLISASSTSNWLNVFFGITLRKEPVSTKTRDKNVSIHVTKMCKALLWVVPLVGNSTSLNHIYWLVIMLVMTLSNWSTVISCIMCAKFRTFIKAVMWDSKFNNKDKIEILDGVCPNWSNILKLLFLINLMNSWVSSKETFFLWS